MKAVQAATIAAFGAFRIASIKAQVGVDIGQFL